jgi:uncharacterized protein (DUF3820 family)
MRVKILLDMDGPGLIFDPTWRDRQAHLIAQQKANQMETPPAPNSNAYRSLFYSRDAFYRAEFISHDELNPEALQQLQLLQQRYKHIQIITARPDFLEPATTDRINQLGIGLAGISIRYKLYAQSLQEKREQYISTADWKGQIAKEEVSKYDLVIFTDDEERNRKAVEALHLGNVIVCASLAECLAVDPATLNLEEMRERASSLRSQQQQVEEEEITFGKHRGTALKDLPEEYLQWMQDPDQHPNGLIRGSINWSTLAFQELQRRGTDTGKELT